MEPTNVNERIIKMRRTLLTLGCLLIASVAPAQTTVTRETVTTTQTEVMRLDSTHVMTVKGFAPGDKISVQTAPDTQPVTVRLDPAVTYVDAGGQPISSSSIDPGSRVRLLFAGTTPEDRRVTSVILVQR
jgi:hypothetical protein